MKKIILIASILLSAYIADSQNSIYGFAVKDIDGNEYALKQLEGKKVMIVNVASKCGFTPQYEALEKLYETYKDDNFVIIAFPANNFKEQEPGTDEEIKQFCTLNYGVSFPIMSKISVKGDDIHPLYKWLTDKDLNGTSNSKVKWNFQKYLIGTNGKIEYVINPWVEPGNKKIIKWIED
ncbi:MAG: glutathione peroxidase [Chlorobi bacterium]|nr:glutathione peroxidase [Chlorobiota bacterium]